MDGGFGVYGDWTIVSDQIRRDSSRRAQVLCMCVCGRGPVWKDRYQVYSGASKGCGCSRAKMHSDRLSTHGLSKSSLYKIWASMIQRCENPNTISYKTHGAMGVKVCSDWRNSFEAFARYVGERPSPNHTLDRHPNGQGNYEPGNVRWATAKEQARNRTSNLIISIEGTSMCLAEWCENLNIDYQATRNRIQRLGWEPRRALETPVEK